MRIDCCRNCGDPLHVMEYCSICANPTKFQCKRCFHFADDPVHSQCVLSMPDSHAAAV